MDNLPKPTYIHDEHGIHILRADGTYSTHRDMERLPNGQIRTILGTGDTITTDEATARDITGWTGLIFTATEKDAQHAHNQARPEARYVDGAMERAPHPAYSDYLAAIAIHDLDAAVDALDRVSTAQGYRGTRESWEASEEWFIVRFHRNFDAKSGRAFKADDLALARVDADGSVVAMSARTGHLTHLLDGYYDIVAIDGLPDLSGATCRHCGQVGIRTEWRFEPRQAGTYSLAGVQAKVAASRWPWAICNGCGHESRGEQVPASP